MSRFTSLTSYFSPLSEHSLLHADSYSRLLLVSYSALGPSCEHLACSKGCRELLLGSSANVTALIICVSTESMPANNSLPCVRRLPPRTEPSCQWPDDETARAARRQPHNSDCTDLDLSFSSIVLTVSASKAAWPYHEPLPELTCLSCNFPSAHILAFACCLTSSATLPPLGLFWQRALPISGSEISLASTSNPIWPKRLQTS